MYTQFFGLNEKPFAITPDPRYLFMSERHGEGLAHLIYGVTDSGGFIQLTGEVGTGKTTLVRSLLGQLPDEVDIALILNPQVTVIEFLQNICQELGLALPDDRHSAKALVDELNRYLLDAHARGRRTILLVDEAQNLSEEVLEQLRLLTNLETARQKLLQVILIGQPELRALLAQNNLRQLAQRVTGRYHLEPLNRDEAVRYIDHRLKVAGAVREIFDRSAKHEVYRLSGGIPRLMNVICDRALLGAYASESTIVDKRMVRRAAAEVSGTTARRWPWRTAGGIAAAIAVGALLTLFWPGSASPPAATATDDAGASPAPRVAAVDAAPADTDDTGGLSGDRPPPSGAPASLDERLREGELGGEQAPGMGVLLERWGVEYMPEDGDPCRRARQAGLRCLAQRGSWGMLRQLDRPALLTLVDSDGAAHYAALAGLGPDRVELVIDDTTLTVPLEEVSPLWLGEFTMIWRPPLGDAVAIRPGMRGRGVVWLRESLAALGNEAPADPTVADYFDSGLENQVRNFQRRHRLQVDGLAGEQTQIMINSLLASDDTPRLSGGT